VPIKYAGYAISYRPGGKRRDGSPDPKRHAHVSIERSRYKELKAYFLDLAPHRSPDRLAREFARLQYEPYAPVRRQHLAILRAVNESRKRAGYARLPATVLRYRRRIVRPFDIGESSESA
jgi:hypothetical protein